MKKLFALILAIALALSLAACAEKPPITEVTDMEYVLQYQDGEYAGTYTGGVTQLPAEGKEAPELLPDGEGVFSFDDGDVQLSYDGAWSAGEFKGNGKLTFSKYLIKFPDVDRFGLYEGDTVDGVAEGSGSFTAVNDSNAQYTYTGEFKNGIFDGQGSRVFDDDPDETETGTYTKGEFTPTLYEAVVYLGGDEYARFSVSDKSKSFLEAHSELFTSYDGNDLTEYLDSEWRLEAFTKNPRNFGDKLAKVDGLTIVQIFEYPFLNYENLTFILATDWNYNYYYTYFFGSADVYEGDTISMYTLPIDYMTYDTAAGAQNWAVANIAVTVSK